jgi:outer membrane autotransporter protein
MPGSNAFALSYDARSTTSTRTELGAWFDNTIALDRGNVLMLHSRAAWAHDHSSNPSLGAVFQTLPGSNFTVTGAQAAPNALLTSLGAELHLVNRWSVGARFDGEFANRSQTYAGTGTVRYAW